MSPSDRALIETFAAGADKMRLAIAGLTRADCVARPGPGDWSIQELVIHMADSDSIGIDRMKRVIAEENPTLVGYDENKWNASLHIDEQSIEDAAIVFEVNRRQFSRVLRLIKPQAMERTGTHTERGRVTLRDLLETYTKHLEHHLKFLHGKRERLGKPVK